MKDFFPIPKTFGKMVKMFFYFLLMVTYFIRTIILNFCSIPLLEKLLVYDRREPYIFILINFAFTLAYLEVFITRIWFYRKCQKGQEEPEIFHLLDESDTKLEKYLLFLTKFIGCGIVILAAYMMVDMIVYHWKENISGSYFNYSCQVFWIFVCLYYVRQHVYDMIVVDATAVYVCYIIEQKFRQFEKSIFSLVNFSDSLMKYQQCVLSLNQAREFVKLVSFANNLIVLPLVGMVVSQFTLEVDTLEMKIIRLTTIVAGSLYVIRGFIFTAYCSRLHSSSTKLHSNLNSLLTRNKHHISIHLISKKILEDQGGRLSHLIHRNMDGGITQMQVLKNFGAVIQLSILVIKFRSQIYQ